MKEFINKIKNMDKTKRIVILFVTISFVFIAGFSIYNGISGNSIVVPVLEGIFKNMFISNYDNLTEYSEDVEKKYQFILF